MLLLLLSFYLHYDLLNSEEINSAKFNESMLVYKHHQNLLQAKLLMRELEQRLKETSVLIADNYEKITKRDEEFVSQDNITDFLRSGTVTDDQKHQNTKDPTKPPAVFLRSPQNNAYDPHLSLFPIFPGSHAPPSVITQPPSPDPIPPVTLKNPELRSGLPYFGSLLSPRNSIYPGMMMPRSLLSINGPGRYIASFSYSPSSTRTTSKRPQILYKEPPLKINFRDENPHKPETFSPAISPSISTLPPSRTMDVDSKIARSTSSHQILKVLNDDTASSQSRVRYTVPTPPRMTPINHEPSSETANTAQLFKEDEHGFLHVSLPETIPEDPNKLMKTTIAGDVLFGKIEVKEPPTQPPKNRYTDVMEQLDEGYLMVFIIEICRLTAVKSTTEMQHALHHMEMIYNSKWSSGQLPWIEDPLHSVILTLLTLPPDKHAIAATQARASMMFHLLLERKEVLSSEVNTIIEDAGMFFNDEDGRRLLDALKNFENYPNTTEITYWICDALMESLLIPFRRASGSPRRKRLMDSINKALSERFPLLLRNLNRPDSGTLTAGESPIGIQPRKIKRKHRNKKQKRKGRLKQINTWEYSPNTDITNSILSTLTPITSDQPMFRAITRKRYRAMKRRSTPAFLPLDHELHTQRVLRQRQRRPQMEEIF